MKKIFLPEEQGFKTSIALLFLRVTAGFAFMIHGEPKIQNAFGWMGPDSPIPSLYQALAAISEFFGGLAWILGLLTPFASIGIFFTMTVAMGFHILRGDPFIGKGGPSYELAAIYFFVAFLFILAGAGRFSLDDLIFRKKIKK